MKSINLFLKAHAVTALAVAGAVVILGAVAINRSGKISACATGNQNAVGQVVSISSGNLSIKDEQSGKLCALQTGGTLHLGDMVIVGQGTRATLKLTAPKGASDDSDLVSIRPMPGKEHPVNIKLERKDDGSIEAAISS